jgi:molybdopterin converting factor small subunit
MLSVACAGSEGMVKVGVTVRLQLLLSQFADGKEVVEIAADSNIDCLNKLTVQYPGLRRWLFTKQGEVAPYVRLFINRRQASVDAELKDGDELMIMLAAVGG